VGEQLLDVRRDKRERASYAAAQDREVDSGDDQEEEVADSDEQTEYRLDMEADRRAREASGTQDE
jgi:hypothetical protein